MPPDRFQIVAEAIYSGGSLHFWGIPFQIRLRAQRKREREQRSKEEGRRKKEEAKVDGSTSSPFPIFNLVLSCFSLSLYLYFWTDL
jgi:hypothetical protein